MQKIVNIASLVGCSLAVLLTGGTIYGYFWATNPKTHEMIKEKAIDAVKDAIPIPGALTGPALPTKSSGKGTQGLGVPSF